jgi:hypothetical protein
MGDVATVSASIPIQTSASMSSVSSLPTEVSEDIAIARFIMGVGLKHPSLRSEIYCQIVKQIIGNPSKYNLLHLMLISHQ